MISNSDLRVMVAEGMATVPKCLNIYSTASKKPVAIYPCVSLLMNIMWNFCWSKIFRL